MSGNFLILFCYLAVQRWRNIPKQEWMNETVKNLVARKLATATPEGYELTQHGMDVWDTLRRLVEPISKMNFDKQQTTFEQAVRPYLS